MTNNTGETMRRLITALCLVVAACSGGATEPVDVKTASISGQWILRTVNGSPLPWTGAGSGERLNSETIGISDAGTFLDSYSSTNFATNAENGGSQQGTYTRSGGSLTLKWTNYFFSWRGSFDGTRLILNPVYSTGELADVYIFTR
jgi:hypothetical protein